MGRRGGIVVMSKKDVLKLDNILVTIQGVHDMVKVTFNPKSWLLSMIYASPDFNTRLGLW